MIAYYVHWYYPPSADDAVYYSGEEDKKLFHKLENADNYAKNRLNKLYKEQKRFDELNDKDENGGLTPEERDEWDALAYTICGDLPNDYKICKREIKFEDD